jgi:YHS domain-containing protein
MACQTGAHYGDRAACDKRTRVYRASISLEGNLAVKLRISLILAAFVGALFLGPGAVAQASDDRLALQGYDPVAYFTEKRPMVGNPQFQHEWDGAIYRFASAKHLEMFKGDPDRYLPQYNNWCAASVAKGVKVRGNPEYWLVADGRLYLFGGPQGPGLMQANPALMKSGADKNWSHVSKLPEPSR